MGKLKYTFKNDVLFKLLFVRNPGLLKRLVAALLAIPPESIAKLEVTNSELPPEVVDEKFCRLDINMYVDGRLVDLEIQVDDEGDYPERTLHYWAREYSGALAAGSRGYAALPCTIVVSIVAFKMFDCAEFHSEFRPLEVTRGTLLTDRMCLHYFELQKVPDITGADNELKFWLALFKARTEADLKKIEEMGGPIMEQAICAYRQVTATDEFKAIVRTRERTKANEISALSNARRRGRLEADEKWQGVVAEKDSAIAKKDAIIADLMAKLGMRA